jgi:oligoribonuclease
MVYISIDIETSGLNPESNNILSFGAIIEDTTLKLPYEKIPKFNAIILRHDICGSPVAINMNKDIISLMVEYLEGDDESKVNLTHRSGYDFLKEDELCLKFYDFLFLNGIYPDKSFFAGHVRNVDNNMLPVFNNHTPQITINVAGKNFATFDKLFIDKLPWWKKVIKIRQRIIDPSVLYCNWNEDESLPNMLECKERAHLEGKVEHTALADAWDVVQMLRKFY